MRGIKFTVYLFFVIMVIFVAAGAYMFFRPAINITDTWTGPGPADGVIVPIKPLENVFHYKDIEGCIEEHWYFDARLDNGYKVVGFLQAMELVSRKPGVELHIYKPSGEKLSAVKFYPESELRASNKDCDIWVGKNHAYGVYPEDGGLPTYHLFISEENLEANLTFDSELPGWKPGEGKTIYGDEGFFAWVVGVPRARVEGTITVDDTTMTVNGIGYHDHNWATADLRKIVSYWYWGRVYTENFTLLYAYIKTNGRFDNVASKPLMLAHKDKILYSTGEMDMLEGSSIFNEKANRTYPDGLEMNIPDKVSLTLEVKDVIDAVDLLEDRNRAVKWFANTFIGRPGWFRFHSNFTLRVKDGAQTYCIEGDTLHEMVAVGGG